MAEKIEQFLITINVIEGRHFNWPNMDTVAYIMVDDQKKCTNVSYKTDCPFYNEYFTFEFSTSLEKLLDTSISFTVIQPRKFLRQIQILGKVTLDTATVWAQPDHQFFNKWAIIEASVKEVSRTPKGYLKLSICILKKGESPVIPDINIESTEDIESNLLLPEGSAAERQKANYVFKIYRGDNLIKTKYLDISNSHIQDTDPPSSYVEVSFAGLKAKTSTVKNCNNPVWNQRLTLTELFPPLYQRIKICLYYVETFQLTYSEHHINLRAISNDGEHGFLPTYGPAFVHFYSQASTNEGCIGKILISINTELQNNITFEKSVNIEHIAGLLEANFWNHEPVLLFGAIFNANLISQNFSKKPVAFEINFGNLENAARRRDGDNNIITNQTAFVIPSSKNKTYWSINYMKSLPCIYISCKWPNFLRRVYNSNIISSISRELENRLKTIESQFELEELKYNEDIIENDIIKILDFLSTSCKKYIDIVPAVANDYETDLDKYWRQLCFREIKNIEQECEIISSLQPKRKCFSKLQIILNQLELLAKDEQTCFPCIYISMVYGNKKVAFSRCSSQDVIYSAISEEKGQYCGVIQHLFLQPRTKSNNLNLTSLTACKLEILLWLGFERHKNALLKLTPDGFNLQTDSSFKSLPKSLIILESHCRVHIYQGKLSPGFDTSGLCDAFVRVTVDDKCIETMVKENTLNPIWDQTLTFKNLVLHGTKSHLTANLPIITIEVYDFDKFSEPEFIGRALLNPSIKFLKDPYRAPNFPPKLSWLNVYNGVNQFGQILIAAEYLEVTKLDEALDTISHVIVTIPNDIKPKLVTYRLEIIFWGVRNLRKVDLFTISKPKVVLECSQNSLQSDTILNIQKKLNFALQKKTIDISLPEEEEFAPPICIKIFDCRSFGRNVLIGTHLVSVNKFFYHALTMDERKQILEKHEIDSFKKKTKPTKSKSSQKTKCSYKLCQVQQTSSTNFDKNIQKPKSLLWQKIVKCCKCYLFKKEKKIKIKNKNKQKHTGKALSTKSFQSKTIKKLSDSEHENEDSKKVHLTYYNCLWKWICVLIWQRNKRVQKKSKAIVESVDDIEEYDWWTKYYNSLSKVDKNIAETNLYKAAAKKCTLKIYLNELELQKEFEGFSDTLKSFEVYKGKRTGDDLIDEANITGIFKGSIQIYKWPLSNIDSLVTKNGLPFSGGVFQSFPSNMPVKFLIRVYCICGINLRPKDVNGKSDPYIVITMNDQIINDRKNYISKQINPVFGRCYELNGVFSLNHSITISVWDWDLTTSDDLIGETKIDIENRFFSRHRASCGLASEYNITGYCAWRDNEKPVKILEKLCKENNIGTPIYSQYSVKITGLEFFWPTKENIKEVTNTTATISPNNEQLALLALQNWHKIPLVGCHLVPEHVETRSLYHPTKLGIEQGKLQLWIDIFPITEIPTPPRIDITPRKPIDYELRVIIWNTEEVILEEDDFFIGEKMSDIYITGWMTNSEESQSTDVHYRSMTGEGNFNWRFIFRFKYLSAENKVVVSKKESLFSVDKTEYKLPCRLTLQVWDNDIISADDFLGTLSLDLSRFPRGAKLVSKCSLDMLSPRAPTINLFKTKRTRGWWPFHAVDPTTDSNILAGKVDAEFELLTVEEAEKRPAGLQRLEPQPLPFPNRPDTSFSWFKNPLKGLKFLICKHYRWKIIKCILFTLLILFMLAAIYSLPGYSVKKLLHL